MIAFLTVSGARAEVNTSGACAGRAGSARYRMDNEDRIIRELSEFLTIPNIASEHGNIQKNARIWSGCWRRADRNATCCRSAGGGRCFRQADHAGSETHVIFYAHYDGQRSIGSVDGWETVRTGAARRAIEASGKRFPAGKQRATWAVYITTIEALRAFVLG